MRTGPLEKTLASIISLEPACPESPEDRTCGGDAGIGQNAPYATSSSAANFRFAPIAALPARSRLASFCGVLPIAQRLIPKAPLELAICLLLSRHSARTLHCDRWSSPGMDRGDAASAVRPTM